MVHLILDTNIWIFLTKPNFKSAWDKLQEMFNNGEVGIYHNDIIIKEWNRNKSSTIRSLAESIKSASKSAEIIKDYLIEPEKTKFEKILTKYKQEEAKRLNLANLHVEAVEKFLLRTTKVSVSDSLKLEVVQMALDKSVPFSTNKNNIADTLILFNLTDYVHRSNFVLHDVIFISDNYKDFCESASSDDIHPDLKKRIKTGLRLKFTRNIGEALQLAPTLVDEMDLWLESELDYQANFQYDIMRGK